MGELLVPAHQYLEETARVLKGHGTVVEIEDGLGFAVSRIVELAQRRPSDLIAISSLGSGGIERLVLGSVATGVIQRSEVPILVVRAIEAGRTWPATDEKESAITPEPVTAGTIR